MIHKCDRCGICCVDIPLTEKELSMFKFLLNIMNKENIDSRIEKYNKHGLKYKLLGTCPFLKENKCEIYNFKPHICDIFPITENCIGKMIRKDKQEVDNE